MITVTIKQRNTGFQVFVGGWRVATYKTEAAAIRRADREVAAQRER